MDSIVFWMFIQDGQAVFTMRESLPTHRSLNKLQMVNYCQTTLSWSVELKIPTLFYWRCSISITNLADETFPSSLCAH